MQGQIYSTWLENDDCRTPCTEIWDLTAKRVSHSTETGEANEPLEERPVPEDPQPKKYREELVDSVYGGRGKVLSRARLYARGPTKEDPKGVSWTITEASKYLYEDDPEDPGLVRIRRRSNVRTSTETLLSVINNLEPNEGVYWVWERTGYIPRGAKLMRGDISARNACRVTVHDYVTSDEWLAWKRRQAQ